VETYKNINPDLAKVGVVGSSPIARSNFLKCRRSLKEAS
jgi:hypothetical protein